MSGQPRPANWLGDAIRALWALKPDAPTTRSILTLLGVDGPGPIQPRTQTQAEPLPRLVVEEPFPTGTVAPIATRTPSRAAVHHQPDPTTALPPVIEPDLHGVPHGADPPRPLPRLADVLPPPQPPCPVPTSLLPPGQQRAILSTLVSRPAPVGDIDVEPVVSVIARREPVTDLPRKPVNTTRLGLQLLLDFGPGMRGFEQDRDEVWHVIANVAGADGLQTLRFAGTPLDAPGAGPGPLWTWRPYRPPAIPRPVLVVSDLGARGPAHEAAQRVARWARTAEALRQAGCSITALAPGPASRVAPQLRSAISIVAWDRSTNARDVAAAVRRAISRLPDEEMA